MNRRQIVLRHTKNGKVQVIPLCSAMVAILRDYMAVREGEASDYLFCNEFGGFLTENALRLAIVKFNNSRGVDRTSIHAFNTLMTPSQYVVGRLGHQASATIVNGIRALSGKGAIYGAAASKHLAKILRSNVITSVLSFAVFSIPDTYNVALRKISGAQYAKNMSVLARSIATGAGGAVAAGVVAAKVAGAAGTAVAPGVGTAVGIAGGFIGGTVGAGVIKAAGDLLHEDDIEVLGRMFNAYVSCMIGEYLLDEAEIDTLVNKIGEVDQKAFKKLFESIAQAEKQEETVRAFLAPIFDDVVAKRPEFLLPSAEIMVDAMVELAGDAEEVVPL